MADRHGPWVPRDDDDFERRIAQEAASAHDLCTALRWHRANIAETLPVIADDGDLERLAEVQQVMAALGRAREMLVRYYHLRMVDALGDDPYARGEPPRLHVRGDLRPVRDAVAQTIMGRAGQQGAMQQLMELLDRHEARDTQRRRPCGFVARLFGRIC